MPDHNEPHSCVGLPRVEALLDDFARGRITRAKELDDLQAHFLTCGYCGRLLRAAEDLRARAGAKEYAPPSIHRVEPVLES